MPEPKPEPASLMRRLLREPLVHFFAIGALLFGAQSALGERERVIVMTPGLRAELARRFRDREGRAPSVEEAEGALRAWQRDEALYREALRLGLDRDDPAVRIALIQKMQAMAGLEVPTPRPSEADLERWLDAHRERYARPIRYDFEFIAFAKSEAREAEELARVERALEAGASPSALGRSLIGGKLPRGELGARVGPELALRIPEAPMGKWIRVEGAETTWLLRLKGTSGGVPTVASIRAGLEIDWKQAQHDEATTRVLDRTVASYRFEERR